MKTKLTWYKQDGKRTYEVWLLPDKRLLYSGPSFLSACRVRNRADKEIEKMAEYNAQVQL